VPSYSLTTPPYPNPATDTNWVAMVNDILFWEGPLSLPGDNPILPSSLAQAASTPCDSNLEARFTIVAAALEGIHDLADSACEIVPDIFVEILGEGAEVPAKEICFAITLIVNGFQQWVQGICTDCDTQDRIINVAEGEAGLANMQAMYNLKLRLFIEQNLESSAGPIGLFELPSSLGGFLEIARAIVASDITQMQAAGYSMTTALQDLAAGDAAFGNGQYKTAYNKYQLAYLAAK
jgi:hypothetical protein